MRTFVQSPAGTTRSCVGCHEDKSSTPPADQSFQQALARGPSRLQPESWGGGPMDYPTMVQPILDRHCVSCHGGLPRGIAEAAPQLGTGRFIPSQTETTAGGFIPRGEQGIAAGLDLTGGWTEHFSISYENLVSRRERQLEATLIAGIDCMNGTALWSAQIFAPRAHGSGAAPLAQLLVKDHGDVKLPRAERDLLMAWIDSNGLFRGTWDSTASGCATKGWKETRTALIAEMRSADCMKCHGDAKGDPLLFEEDWVNLEQPELSRILRAPLAAGADGFGLGFCRDRVVNPKQQRVRQLVNGYAHAVQPVEAFARRTYTSPDRSGAPVVSFSSTQDAHYQSMLTILRQGQKLALAEPRVDMPGAKIIPGESRQLLTPALPERLPALHATATGQGVQLSWDHRADLSGLTFELHRSKQPSFTPDESSRLVSLTRSDYLDPSATPGDWYYALTCIAGEGRTAPVHATVTVTKSVQTSDASAPRDPNLAARIK